MGRQKNTTKNTKQAKAEEVKVDETVAEEETATDVAEEETKTEDSELSEEESELDSDEADESEEDEPAKTDEKVDATVETKSAEADVTKFAVYQGSRLVKVYNSTTHGDDFVKIAKAHAERIGGKAAAYSDTVEEEVERDVAVVVNASNSVVRKFSLVAHGEDYATLAANFVGKHPKRGYRVL